MGQRQTGLEPFPNPHHCWLAAESSATADFWKRRPTFTSRAMRNGAGARERRRRQARDWIEYHLSRQHFPPPLLSYSFVRSRTSRLVYLLIASLYRSVLARLTTYRVVEHVRAREMRRVESQRYAYRDGDAARQGHNSDSVLCTLAELSSAVFSRGLIIYSPFLLPQEG